MFCIESEMKEKQLRKNAKCSALRMKWKTIDWENVKHYAAEMERKAVNLENTAAYFALGMTWNKINLENSA